MHGLINCGKVSYQLRELTDCGTAQTSAWIAVKSLIVKLPFNHGM